MDTKIIRAGLVSGLVLLVAGALLGNYGGWAPILDLVNNFLGISLIITVLSIFLTFIYSNWFSNFLPGTALSRGVLFGALVWVVFLILGGLFGFFKNSVYPEFNPGNTLFLSLILNILWGSITSIVLETKP